MVQQKFRPLGKMRPSAERDVQIDPTLPFSGRKDSETMRIFETRLSEPAENKRSSPV
jgi:hypothetical protein